ncbi:MAG: hypothetical protein H0U73_12400 [Tatlockia sp.]|nr:hypothetical protein [Tatlockia sp.]
MKSRLVQQFLHSDPAIEKQAELETLLNFIQYHLSDFNSGATLIEPHSVPERDTAESKDKAVTLLQRMIRLQLLSTTFFSPNGQKMYWDLLDRGNLLAADSETHLLAKLMFGKTIAKTVTNQYYPADLLKLDHKGEYDFPVMQHCVWNSRKEQSTAGYHRWSSLDERLAKKIADLYLEQPDHSTYKYLPVSNANNFRVELALNKYHWKNRDLMKVYAKAQETICVIQIPLGDPEENVYAKVNSLLKAAGLIASPFAIANFLASKKEMENEINDRPNNFRQFSKLNENDFFDHNAILEKSLPCLPDTLSDLIEHAIMAELAGIAISRDSPVKYLAAYLHRLISAIPPEYNIDEQGIQRISLFLSFAVKLHRQYYERFAFLSHVISHEISLILNQVVKKGGEITNYKKFKKTVERNFISTLGLQTETNSEHNYQSIASPANSGCHAFVMACELAKKMNPQAGDKPFTGFYAPIYHEFFQFMKTGIRFNNKQKKLADIYHISAGPLAMNPDQKIVTVPGTDINLFVNYLLSIGLSSHSKGVVIIVDTTTALKKNLVLDEMTKKMIEEGKISIICHQSYQKFELAHTDQVQGGIVFGVCSKKTFSPDDLHQFEENAEKDLMNSFDMQLASFIKENTGHYPELIKLNHFKNGEMIKNAFMKPSYNVALKQFNYDFMIKNPDESYFYNIDKYEDPALYDAVYKNIELRQGFGHFNSTISAIDIDKSIRLSAGASDKIDTLIEITQLKLFSLFGREHLLMLLNLIVKHGNENLDSREDEILLAGLLMALKNGASHSPEFSEKDKTTLMDGINILIKSYSRLLSGRKSLQTLYRFSINPHFYEFNSKELGSWLANLDESKKIATIIQLQSDKKLERIIWSEYDLNSLLAHYPVSMKLDLACQFSDRIGSIKLFLQIMNSLPDKDKYPFVMHSLAEIKLESAWNAEYLLAIITNLPEINDAFLLVLAFNEIEENSLNIETILSIAEFFNQEPNKVLKVLDKFLVFFQQSRVDQKMEFIDKIQKKINFYNSISQRLFTPKNNEAQTVDLKSSCLTM